MSRTLSFVILMALAGLVGFRISSVLTSFGQEDLDGSFVRPNDASTPEYRELSVDEARAFDDFSAYWVGQEFQGLALRRIIRKYSPHTGQPEDYIVFIYGTCTPIGDGGCMPPLQIRTEPYCYKQPGLIADRAKQGAVFKVRGADAQYISEGLRIWTGSVSVRIGGDPAVQSAVAEALTTVNAGPIAGAGDPLPAVNANCSDFTLEPFPN